MINNISIDNQRSDGKGSNVSLFRNKGLVQKLQLIVRLLKTSIVLNVISDPIPQTVIGETIWGPIVFIVFFLIIMSFIVTIIVVLIIRLKTTKRIVDQ